MSTPPEAETQVLVVSGIIPAAEALTREQRLADDIVAGRADAAHSLWRSAPALMATTRDTALPGFAAACAALEDQGWPVLVRRSGGGAFAIGPGTLQLAAISRRSVPPHSIDTVYDALARPLVQTLRTFGLDAETGSVPGAVCDGRHDIAIGGRKVAGLAQRWRHAAGGTMCVIASASLIVDADPGGLTDIVNRFYALAGSTTRCRREAMTSMAARLSAGQSVALAKSDLMSAVTQRLCAALKAAPGTRLVSEPAAASRGCSSPA